MKVYTCSNVNEVYPLAIKEIQQEGIEVSPRGSRTLEFPTPVTTVYKNPKQCILFDPVRDENPFFLVMEAIWILAGRDDVAFLDPFLPGLKQFSDDGKYYHGAYGARMHRFKQLDYIISLLKKDPDTRRAVVSIYQPHLDTTDSKDIPCNDMLFFKLRKGRMNLSVANRSNDLILGCYSVNKTQFSFVLQYVAAAVGAEVGELRQVSDSLHVYVDSDKWNAVKHTPVYNELDPYSSYDAATKLGLPDIIKTTSVVPIHEFEDFKRDLKTFFSNYDQYGLDAAACAIYQSSFFSRVVVQMAKAHKCYRNGDLEKSLNWCYQIGYNDWMLAAVFWIKRRLAKRV